MGFFRGPNIIKDGLVFGYDTNYGVADNSTSTRFFPGEPTSNGLNYPDFSQGVSPYNTHTVTVEDSTSSLTGKVLRIQITGINNSNRVQFSKDASFNTTQTATLSVYAKGVGNTVGKYIQTFSGAAWYNGIGPLTSEYKRFTVTITTGSGSGGPGNIGLQSETIGDVFYIHSPQLGVNTHATPFVDGTRSSTQSLIDLKRTTDIDVSNVSFDSTGQPTFDGTDDVISIDVDDIVRQSTNITIEGIVELGSIGSGGPWSIMTDHATTSDRDGFWWHMNINGSVYFRVEDNVNGEQGTTFSGGVPFIANTTQHIVTIVGALGVFIYVNGELSKTYTPSFKWSQIDSSKTAYLTIGRTYPNYFLNSKNRVVKMYNRALTTEEIKQNFNAYKNRFDI